MREFYVYKVYVDKELRYVGKGKGGRFKHASNGKSSNKKLNEAYFSGRYIKVTLYKWGLSEEEALLEEAKLIKYHYYKLYNKNRSHLTKSVTEAVLPKGGVGKVKFLDLVGYVENLPHKYQKCVGAMFLCEGSWKDARQLLPEGFLRRCDLSWDGVKCFMKDVCCILQDIDDNTKVKVENYFKDLLLLPTSKNIQKFYNFLVTNIVSGYGWSFSIKVSDLREHFGLEYKYENFKDLRRHFINPYLGDMRKTTAFQKLKFSTEKRGCWVVSVKFSR